MLEYITKWGTILGGKLVENERKIAGIPPKIAKSVLPGTVTVTQSYIEWCTATFVLVIDIRLSKKCLLAEM